MQVFHVIGTSESILMSWLFAVACGAHVPIFHIKFALEIHVLIGMCVDNVGVFWVLLLERWMDARGDVRDHAGVWDGGRHRGAVTSTAAFATSTSAATTSTASSTSSRRIVGLLLETVERGRGIVLVRQGHIHIVACCGGICRKQCHLFHQQLLLLMKLHIVSGELLEGCIDLGCIGFEGCRRLHQKVGHVGVDSNGDGFSSVVVQDVIIHCVVGLERCKAVARCIASLPCHHCTQGKAMLVSLLNEQA